MMPIGSAAARTRGIWPLTLPSNVVEPRFTGESSLWITCLTPLIELKTGLSKAHRGT